MMSDSKMLNLFERLYEATLSGKLEWVAVTDGAGFEFFTNNYKMSILKTYNSAIDDHDYRIQISDLYGNVVEEFWDIVILDQVGDGNRSKYYKMYGEIYETARRKALGADKAVDEIMNFLK